MRRSAHPGAGAVRSARSQRATAERRTPSSATMSSCVSPASMRQARRYLEINVAELEDRRYLGLLAPAALGRSGWFSEWIGRARDFGEKISQSLRDRIIGEACPPSPKASTNTANMS